MEVTDPIVAAPTGCGPITAIAEHTARAPVRTIFDKRLRGGTRRMFLNTTSLMPSAGKVSDSDDLRSHGREHLLTMYPRSPPPWSSPWGQTQSGGKGVRSDKGRGAFGIEPLEGDLVAAPFGSDAWGRRWGKVPSSKSPKE